MDTPVVTIRDLQGMKLLELQKQARDKYDIHYARKRKAELIECILQAQKRVERMEDFTNISGAEESLDTVTCISLVMDSSALSAATGSEMGDKENSDSSQKDSSPETKKGRQKRRKGQRGQFSRKKRAADFHQSEEGTNEEKAALEVEKVEQTSESVEPRKTDMADKKTAGRGERIPRRQGQKMKQQKRTSADNLQKQQENSEEDIAPQTKEMEKKRKRRRRRTSTYSIEKGSKENIVEAIQEEKTTAVEEKTLRNGCISSTSNQAGSVRKKLRREAKNASKETEEHVKSGTGCTLEANSPLTSKKDDMVESKRAKSQSGPHKTPVQPSIEAAEQETHLGQQSQEKCHTLCNLGAVKSTVGRHVRRAVRRNTQQVMKTSTERLKETSIKKQMPITNLQADKLPMDVETGRGTSRAEQTDGNSTGKKASKTTLMKQACKISTQKPAAISANKSAEKTSVLETDSACEVDEMNRISIDKQTAKTPVDRQAARVSFKRHSSVKPMTSQTPGSSSHGPAAVCRTSAKKLVKSGEKGSQIPRFVSFVRKKTPNFAALHKKAFEKMESLDEYLVNRQKRTEMVSQQLKKAKTVSEDTRLAMEETRARTRTNTGGKTRKLMHQEKTAKSEANPVFVPSVTTVSQMKLNFADSKQPITFSGVKVPKQHVKTPVFSLPGKMQHLVTKTSQNVPSAKSSSEPANENFAPAAATPSCLTLNQETPSPASSVSRGARNSKTSLTRPLHYKPYTGKIKPFGEINSVNSSRTNPYFSMANKQPPTKNRLPDRKERREFLKGVRTNKRFELQMQQRGLV